MSEYEKFEPKCTFSEVELKPDLRAAIQEVIDDREMAHALEREGLIPRKRILLHGPPGCGKTSIAHALASEVKLPLYVASGAQIIDAYVGGSEKNIEKLFKFAESEECVLLVDEFDTFSRDRSRGARYEANMVNTLLVNMEARVPAGIVIACTNFLDIIDSAVTRRFDVILEVPGVSREMLIKIAENTLKGRFSINPEECAMEGRTPSGTVRAAKNKLRSAVLSAERANPTPKPQPKRVKPEPEPQMDYSLPSFNWGGGRANRDFERIRMPVFDQSIFEKGRRF